MPSNLIGNIVAAVAGAGTTDVQPPAGEAWVIYEVGSDVAFVGLQPDLSYGIADGVLTLSEIVQDPADDPQKGARAKEIYINNGHYLTITNEAVGAANIGWTGERVDPNIVITDLVTSPVGGLTYVDIQPPAGETWRITEIGAELYDGVTNRPEVTVGVVQDALTASMIIQELCDRGQEKLYDWIIDNDVYLRVTCSGAADVDFAFCGVRIPETSIGSVTDVVGSATLDIQPPATEEWVITEFAAELWTGAAVTDLPDIDVSIYDGAVIADVLEAGAISQAWNRRLKLHLDNANYLRITETGGGANNEVGVLGYLKREYS